MRNPVERLRIGLVVSVCAVVLLLAAFLGYAHYRSRLFLAGLPGKLGVGITRETSGYTFSRSTKQGRTLFTLHAAKLEQRRNGVVALHDVSVILYGREPGHSDRFSGSEFEYDANAGVVRALGKVQLELEAPAAASVAATRQAPGGPALAPDDPKRSRKVIRVETSGLVYLEHLGVAATAEDISFSEGQMSGRAHGADFNSDTGLVILYSAVEADGTSGGHPVHLTADHAEFNRTDQIANLKGARLVTPGESLSARQAIVHVRPDGSPEQIDASEGVAVSRPDGGSLSAQRATLRMTADGKPRQADFAGNVRYADNQAASQTQGHPVRQTNAQAAEARMLFDPAGHPEHLSMRGAVGIEDNQRRLPTQPWQKRSLSGDTVEIALAQSPGSARSEARELTATGAARLAILDEPPPANASGDTRTELAGDTLHARFAPGMQVSDVLATGRTSLHQLKTDLDEVSSADSTELVFRDAPQQAPSAPRKIPTLQHSLTNPASTNAARAPASPLQAGPAELATATQSGHVSAIRKGVSLHNGVPTSAEDRATADHALYEAGTNRVTLTGTVVLTGVDSTLWTNHVVVDRTSGDATAEGGVRVTYLQPPAEGKESDPIHVLADHAELKRLPPAAPTNGTPSSSARAVPNRGLALFFGTPIRMARMWQGASQVEAPELAFDQAARRLTASGPSPNPSVHAVLVSATPQATPTSRAASPNGKPRPEQPPAVVRIAAREMVYTDGAREVLFNGSVSVRDRDGTMKADNATAYLKARPTTEPAPNINPTSPIQAAFPAGSLDRIVATGKVTLDQPERHATGEQLVYTAADALFVLTGTPAAPPRVEDQARGTTTGATLRFHTGDDAVDVLGAPGPTRAGFRTETRVKP